MRKTLIMQFLIVVLLISTVTLPGTQAEVSSLEVTPASPSQGDVVMIRISAQPEEEVAITISFSKTLSVVDGKYEWFLNDVYVPSTPNRVSVRAENVVETHLSVKIIFWITKSAAATDGIVTLSQSNVPKGTYDLRLHGDAVSNASEVTLDVIASTTVKMDSTGSYDYSYNTSNIPIGLFTVEAGPTKKTVNLTEKGSPPPPTEDEFIIGDLSLYPLVSSVDTQIRVSVMVSNTGERIENRAISFALDGAPFKEEKVSLEAGESTYLDFSLPVLEGGWHILTVETTSRSFVVIPAQTDDTTTRVFETLKGIPSELAAEILDTLYPEDTSNGTEREGDLEISKAVEVIEAAVDLGLTNQFSTLLLNMEKEEGASLLVSLEPGGGSALLESMYLIDPQECAALVEAATSIEIGRVVEMLDLVETDLLSRILLEIARLPSTPSTVALLFQEMSADRVIAIVQTWIKEGYLREIGLVLDKASEETLDSVITNLGKGEQSIVLPHLRSETFARINPSLLVLPDLSVFEVSADALGSMRYRVTVDIRNTGVEDADFDVALTVDGARVDAFTVDELKAGEDLTVEFEWEPDVEGAFRIGAVVDGDNGVFEINELDNTGYLDVVVESRSSGSGLYIALGALALVIAGVLYLKYR